MNKKIKEQIDTIVSKDSTIAIHTVSGSNAIEDAMSILWNGMKQSERTRGGLPGNFVIVNDTVCIEPNIYASDINNNKVVVVVSIPEVMMDKNGEEWYMGIYPTGCSKYDRDVDTLPINQLIESESFVPREFIAGLVVMNEGKSVMLNGNEMISGFVEKFVPNSKFIGSLTQEEQANFFETIKGKLIHYGMKRVNGENDLHSTLDSLFDESTYYKDQLSAYRECNLKNK